mgnify:CR=1 FL=1
MESCRYYLPCQNSLIESVYACSTLNLGVEVFDKTQKGSYSTHIGSLVDKVK